MHTDSDHIAAHVQAQEEAVRDSHTAALQAIEQEREYLLRVERAMLDASKGRSYYRPPGRQFATQEISEYFQDVRTLETLRKLQERAANEERARYSLARMRHDLEACGYHVVRQTPDGPIWGLGDLILGTTAYSHARLRGELTESSWEVQDRELAELFQAVQERAADRAIGSVTDLEG